jgi:hypothetical protein
MEKRARVKQETTFIYTLSDSITGLVRYVGKANNPVERYRGHIGSDLVKFPHWYKCRWVKTLLQKNMLPVLHVIDEVPVSEWQEAERHWIAYYRGLGFPLTNTSDGGDGQHGYKHTEEAKAKFKQRQVSETIRQKIAQAGRARRHTPEIKQKIAQAHQGKKPTEQAIESTRGLKRPGASSQYVGVC